MEAGPHGHPAINRRQFAVLGMEFRPYYLAREWVRLEHLV